MTDLPRAAAQAGGGGGMIRHRIAYFAAAAVLVLPLASCGEAADTDLGGIEVDRMDCDAEDRRKKKTPDCGRYVGGKYREWSWVSKGSKPPPGWTPAREPSVSQPAPKTSTAKKRTSGKTTVDDGRSRRTTNNRSGTTRRR